MVPAQVKLRGRSISVTDAGDLRGRSLSECLEKLVLGVRDGWLLNSETFNNAAKLLVAADRMGLEGIVLKMANTPYRSGSQCMAQGEEPELAEGNRDRWRLFKRL